MSLVCSISLEAVDDPVMTVSGSIYERKSIEEWFKKNQTDPNTGLTLSSKILLKIDKNLTMEEIDKKAKELRNSTQKSEISEQYEQLLGVYKGLHLLKRWSNYDKKYKEMFEICLTGPYGKNEDEHAIIENDFQFVDLKKNNGSLVIAGKSLLNCKFNFANLKNVVFFHCEFQNTSFIGTNFDNVEFLSCSFMGKTTFYKASSSGEFAFTYCKAENPFETKTFDYLVKDIEENLKERGLSCPFTIK